MFRSFFVALAIIASAASLSFGDDQIIQDTPHDVPLMVEGEIPTKADTAYGVLYAEGRITKLPQDANKFYLTILGNKNDAKYKEIVVWFEGDPQLKNYKAQCHFNKIDTDKQIFAERYEKTVPALPCIRVQQADGKTLFQASGKNIPMTAEALAKGMSTECLFRWRRNNRNPAPNPDPDPDLEPAPNPDTDGDDAEPDDDEAAPDTVKPDVAPDTKPNEPNHMMTVLAIIAAIGGGIALGGGHAFANNLQQYRANHR